MLERLWGAVLRGLRILVCQTFDVHAPEPALKANRLFFYGRCEHCNSVITRIGSMTWRSARHIEHDYLAEMRNVSTELLWVARD